MATTLFMQRVDGNRLAPETASDAEAMDGMARGVTYRIVATRAAGRSLRHHNLLFALIAIARENYDGPITTDAVLDVLKLQTGHTNVVKLLSGQIILTPKSISFVSMGHDEFKVFFDKALVILCRDFVPGLDLELAKREIAKRAGLPANDVGPALGRAA